MRESENLKWETIEPYKIKLPNGNFDNGMPYHHIELSNWCNRELKQDVWIGLYTQGRITGVFDSEQILKLADLIKKIKKANSFEAIKKIRGN